MVTFEVQVDGTWSPINPEYHAQLCRQFASGASMATISAGGKKYMVDFRRLTQTNLGSGAERPLRLTGSMEGGSAEAKDTTSVGASATIHVKVIQGKGLYGEEKMSAGKADPYCIVGLVNGGESHKSERTSVIENGGDAPIWESQNEFTFLWEGERHLHFVVMDEDTGKFKEGFSKTDDMMGECYVNVPVVAASGHFSGWLKVYHSYTKPYGELQVEIKCHNVSPDVDARHLLLEVTPAKMYRNYRAGLAHVMAGERWAMFKTFAVALQDIPDIFEDRFNANYDDEHKVIFADTASSETLRAAIRAEHDVLYHDGDYVTDIFRVDDRVHSWPMFSGRDFLNMIKHGIRASKRRVYTYSIIDKGMFFSETGMTLQDQMSKHVVHSNAAFKVRCSGTFRICNGANRMPVMIIDNDSGTYRPDGRHLPCVERVLRHNLPGLEVRALNVVEPQPINTKALVGPNEAKDSADAVYPGIWVWQTG